MSEREIAHKIKDLAEKILKRRIALTSRAPFLSFQKRFLEVRMDLTHKCNISCFMCLRAATESADTRAADMDWNVFLKISREVFPRAQSLFLSCGAEPLMARHFPDALDVVREAGIPFVAFTTNGLLLSEKIIRKIIDSGVDEIYISFDGAQDATFAKIRGGASLSQLIEKVTLFNDLKETLSASKPELEFHTTLMRSNIEEIADIIQIAHDLRVPRVSAMRLTHSRELAIDEEDLSHHRELYDRCVADAQKKAEELGVEFKPPMMSETEEAQSAMPSAAAPICLHPWATMVIFPDGGVIPCARGYLNEKFGSFSEDSFEDIWYGVKYSRIRRDIKVGRPQGGCARCAADHTHDG